MSMLLWPSNLVPNSQQFFPVFNTRKFKSPFTGSSQTLEFPACFWQCQLSFKHLDRDQLRALETFVLQLRGAAGRFQLGDQANAEPTGAAEGSPVVDGAGQTGGLLTIQGCTKNQNFLLAGDYITVNNELLSKLIK